MIVVDTNALIYAVKNKKRIEDYIDDIVIVPSSVIGELRNLSYKNSDAKIALTLATRYKVIKVNGAGDRGVEEAAVITNSKVLTSDRALRKRLSEKGITTLTMGKRGVRK